MVTSPQFGMDREITKAILESVGTDFLLKDGSRAMTGDLDLPYTKGINFGNVLLIHHAVEGTEYLMIRNAANTVYKHLLLGTMAPESLTGNLNPFYMRTAIINGAYFVFQTFNSGAYSSIAYMRNNDFVLYDGKTLKTNTIDETTTDSGVTLPHVGDITLLPLKTLTVDPSGEIVAPYDSIAADPWPALTGLANGSIQVVYNSTRDEARLFVGAGGKTNAYYVNLTAG